jgi:DNA-directed RNA polymerase specialized sigma24 family protein
LLKRYAKSAKEPAPLFDSIGEDLASSNEEVRKTAFWALVAAMPELTNILHERETRQPGWRDVEGKDQQMVNRGSDILSYLHRVLVKKQRFKIRGENGKDPRPFINTAINNRKIDVERRRRNKDGTPKEEPLDYEASLEIPAPGDSVEDSALENKAYEERKRELRGWGFFRSDDELALFETVHVDDSPFDEVRERLGIPSDAALRKRLSRTNKNIVAVRDGLFALLLISKNEFSKRGKIPRFPQDIERSEEWVKRVKRSVKPSGWVGAVQDGKTKVAVRSLTTSLLGAPGHIYLAAIRNDCNYLEKGLFWHPKRDPNARDVICIGYNEILDWLINLNSIASREQLPTCYIARRFRRYASKTGKIIETELPGVNNALDGVSDEYETWLL